MTLAKVNVDLDQEQIQAYINEQLKQSVQQTLLLVDVNRLVGLTSMSPRFLEDTILCDPRIRIHERRKNRKRWWLYEPTIEAIKEILNEW